MAKFRKKPVVIEAVQLRWDTWNEMCDHAGVGKISEGNPEGCFVDSGPDGFKFYSPNMETHYSLPNGYAGPDLKGAIAIAIPTPEGNMFGIEGDWIIRGVAGELYPCKPHIFEATYEAV